MQRFPGNRRLVVAALRAGRHKTPMYGLLDLDVTLARRLLAATDPPSSMTAFLAASAARAAVGHPEVHAYRDWRGRLVTHKFVDVSTMVEIATAQGPFPMPHTLHDADIRSVADLSGELRRIKTEPLASPSARWAERYAPWATRIPGAIPAVYAVMARSVASRRRIGTVAVTSIGMFGGGAGYGLTPLTLMSLELVVGGIGQQPRVVDGKVEVRDVLNLTLAIDHDVVDGAPAARFAAELREVVETAAVLTDPVPIHLNNRRLAQPGRTPEQVALRARRRPDLHAEGRALHGAWQPQDNTAVTEGSLAGAVAACQTSGAAGWDLVDQASRLVHDRFTTYSVLHVWEQPQTAFGRRRGYCVQYNGALAQILRRLGFDAWMVYAAHVRFDNNPEWSLGHAWVRVQLGGDVRDVCARSASNRPGSVGFVCLGRVRRLGPVARVASAAGTAAAAFAAVLLARLRGQSRPRWVEHARVGNC